MNLEQINGQLIDLSIGNEEYAIFNKKIVNTKKQVLGVRLPDIRRLAKRAAKNHDFSSLNNLLDQIDDNIYEQVFVTGLMINQLKISDEQRKILIDKYLTKVDSWALIDSFITKKDNFSSDFWWQSAQNYLKSNQQFTVRLGVIILMKEFLTEYRIDQVFELVNNVKNDAYYIRIAIAWLYAEAAINFYILTIQNLKNNQLDNWTSKKACQKMLESRRLSAEQKTEIKELRNQF